MLLLQLVPSLIAQTAGIGVLTGRVVDSSGNPVANATVTVTSMDNGQAQSDHDGADGTYRFDDLPPGNYRMKLEAAGFKTLEIPSATVDGTRARQLWTRSCKSVRQPAIKPTPDATGKFTECAVQQYGAFAFRSGPYSGTDSGKRPGAGAAG